MRSVGGGDGLDITQDMKPPKSLYIEVSTSLRSVRGAFAHIFSNDHLVTMSTSRPQGEMFEGPWRV